MTARCSARLSSAAWFCLRLPDADAYRDARPFRHDLGDVIRRDLLLEQRLPAALHLA